MIETLINKCQCMLYRNSIALIFNSAFCSLFGLLFWIVAARLMSAEEIGLATSAISVVALIVGLSKLGMDSGLVRYLPGTNNKRGLYSTVTLIALSMSLLLAILFLIGVTFFSPSLAFLREGWFVLIFFGYVIISSLYSVQNVTFITLRRADLTLIQNLVLGARILILLIIPYLGTLGIFLSMGITFFLSFIFGELILQRYGISLELELDISALRKITKFSLGNYTAGIFTMLPTTILPIMILNTIGSSESAYFYIAYSISGLLTMIPSAVTMSLFVEGSHNLPLKENVIKSVKMIVLMLLPALAFIYFFGDQMLLLFSKEYSEEAFEMLLLLSVTSIFSAVISVYVTIKKIQKDIRKVNYLNFLLSMLIIIIGYVALLKYGLIGLGYAWLGSNVIVGFLVILMVYKEKLI